MAGEVIDVIPPAGWYREKSVGYNYVYDSVPVGVTRGLSLQKLIQAQLIEYYHYEVIIPAVAALATGITLRCSIVDDMTSAADLGTVVRLGLQATNLSTALAPVDWSLAAARGTEAAANVTLSATAGVAVTATVAIATAQLAGLAAGNLLSLRLRRIGDNAADTCPGRVVLLTSILTNT